MGVYISYVCIYIYDNQMALIFHDVSTYAFFRSSDAIYYICIIACVNQSADSSYFAV